MFILTVASVAVKADYGKIQTIKITLKSGDVYEYYVPKINSITFSENKVNEPEGEGTLDLNVIIGELQSVLADEKNSVVPTNTTEYERNRTASVDVFAGYVTPNSQFGGWLKHTYQWPNRYYNLACNAGPVDMLYNAYTYAESLGVPEYKAIAQIVYAQTALNAVNNAGCLPYHDLRELKATRPLNYLSQEETYNAILADLDEAIATLKIIQPGKESLMLVEGDAYDKGDVDYAFSEYRWQKWVKLANTVKLRIAMYLAKPNEALAKQVAMEALADEVGVLDEDFGPAYRLGFYTHPYYTISGEWMDCSINASFENILKRTGSPLIGKYFKKNTGAVQDKITGKNTKAGDNYYGIRQGAAVSLYNTYGIGYTNFSHVSISFKYQRLLWVTKEEVLFLKAEYALRWGNDADAKNLYEAGIRSACEKFGIDYSEIDKYLAQTQVVQQKKGTKYYDYDYVDIYDSKNNLPGRLNICVAWNSADSKETKLEKLITQKWIAIFPNGQEAWVDYRRTGYPRLYPSVQPWEGTPTFPVELQLRRIPHDESDENIVLYDMPNIESALTIFGVAGENAGGQRLYFEGDPTIYPWTYDEETGWFIPKNFVKSSGVSDEDEALSVESEMKLYPSPMRNELTIDGCNAGDKIMIVDMTGRIYYNAISQSEKETIDVSSYPSGLYIVSIGENVRKVVKVD